LHTTTGKLDDPDKRRGIVAFVRALIDAQRWYRDSPAAAQEFVAETLGHPAELMERVWEDERFGGELVADLLDVMEEEELWLAEQESRQPRTRDELAPLIDRSIAEEALALP
jgi:NitT/TauT family transport system substrate-binding protein